MDTAIAHGSDVFAQTREVLSFQNTAIGVVVGVQCGLVDVGEKASGVGSGGAIKAGCSGGGCGSMLVAIGGRARLGFHTLLSQRRHRAHVDEGKSAVILALGDGRSRGFVQLVVTGL